MPKIPASRSGAEELLLIGVSTLSSQPNSRKVFLMRTFSSDITELWGLQSKALAIELEESGEGAQVPTELMSSISSWLNSFVTKS